MMLLVGWYRGGSWCAFFVRLVLLKAFADDKRLAVIRKCCSGNAQLTFANFKKDGTFQTGQNPKNGALAVWQFGKSSSGHIGIISNASYDPNTFQDIEGNTNGGGSREGDQVAEKLRTLKRDFKATGLNLIGFVYLAD